MKQDLRSEQTWLITVSLMIIAVVAIGSALLYARSVLIPFVLAVFISLLVSPVLDFQVLRLKIPRPIAIVVTLVFVLAVLGLLYLLINQAILTIIATAKGPSLVPGIVGLSPVDANSTLVPGIVGGSPADANSTLAVTNQYSDNFVNLVKRGLETVQDWGVELDQGEIVGVLQTLIPRFVTYTFGTILGFLTSFVLVSVFVIFLVMGRNSRVIHKGIYADVDKQIRRYIATKATVSVVTGTLVWLILALFGLELAGVFGICAFLLNFIPSIGSVIATLLPIPIAVAQFQNPWLIAGVILIPGTIQMAIGNVIEPKLLGKGLHLHPVTILLALSFWGLLWGVVGMLLAVPITAIARIVIMQFDTLKPVANLMAGQLPASEK